MIGILKRVRRRVRFILHGGRPLVNVFIKARDENINFTFWLVRYSLFRQISPRETRLINRIERQRKLLERNQNLITFIGYGSKSQNLKLSKGETQGKKITKSISEICQRSSKKRRQATYLFRLVRGLKPKVCLELGTCFGISASYVATALNLNKEGKLITIEGAAPFAKIAKRVLTKLELQNTKIINARFQDALPKILKENQPDLVFIDGHHEKFATIDYFKMILKVSKEGTIFVFDDIFWSKGMEEAWKIIKSDRRVRFSADLHSMGLVVV